MSTLWIKYYIHNATHWDLTEHDIQCRPSVENPTKFTNTVDILLFLFKKKKTNQGGNDKLCIEWKQDKETEKIFFFEKTR